MEMNEMEIADSIEVIVGTYEELTLGYRLVKDSEENKVAHKG